MKTKITTKFKNFFEHNILPPLSGAIMALPFLFYSAGWLNIVCLLPFLYWLHLQYKSKFEKSFVVSTWAIGLIFFLIVVSWIANTRPDNWAYIEGWQGGIGLFIIYLLFVLFLSVQFLLFGWIYKKIKIDILSKWSFLVLPAVWIVCEVFRSYLFSIVSYGPNSTIGPYWNFGVLGFSAGVTPIGFTARFIGLYGLSFAVVLINLSFFWILHKRYKLPAFILVSIIILSILSYALYAKPNGERISIASVQLPATDNNSLTTSYQENLQKLMQGTRNNSIDLFLLPEYSEFYSENEAIEPDGNLAAKKIFDSYLNPQGGTITSISGEKDKPQPTNDLVVFSSAGKISTSHKKQFLIPLGEYMPHLVAGLLKITGQSEALKISESTQNVRRGTTKEPPVIVAGKSIGALACSAAIAPELYRGMVVQGAEVLTNSASLGTFTKAPLYHAQSRQMARFDAIANARPFVQASTGAYSYFIDNNGKFIYRTTKTELNYKQIDIKTNKTKTPYSVLGEWVVLLSFVGIIALLVKSYTNKKVML